MSQWTHITSCLSVDTFIEEKPDVLKALVEKYLATAPRISGSERDAEIYINVKSGYNTWTQRDCEHCYWNNTLVDKKDPETGDEYQECDAPEDHTCQEGQYQTCIIISIQGDLRDRTVTQTTEEFSKFIEYVKKEYLIRDYSLNIEGD